MGANRKLKAEYSRTKLFQVTRRRKVCGVRRETGKNIKVNEGGRRLSVRHFNLMVGNRDANEMTAYNRITEDANPKL